MTSWLIFSHIVFIIGDPIVNMNGRLVLSAISIVTVEVVDVYVAPELAKYVYMQ